MEQLRLYDENNYYFYFTRSNSNAYKIMEQVTQRYGELRKLDGIISFDCNENFQYRLPLKGGRAVLDFVFGLIYESDSLQPSILGCRIRDITAILGSGKPAFSRAKINMINNAICLIKSEHKGLSNNELLRLLISHYGLYTIGSKYINHEIYQADNYIIPDCSTVLMRIVLGEDADISLLQKLDQPANPSLSKWKTEQELYYLVLQYFPDALQHYSPLWLNRQHLDIYIPSLSIAIEYQGKQHYEPIEYFGGAESFEYRVELDSQKRMLCADNNITLIELPYSFMVNAANLLFVLQEHGVERFPHPVMNPLPPNKKEVYRKEFGSVPTTSSPVILNQFSLDGSFIRSFKGYTEAVENCKVSKVSIYRAASGYAQTAGGYQWRFGEENLIPDSVPALDTPPKSKVIQYSLLGEMIAEYDSISAAAKAHNIDPSNLRSVLNSETKSAGGYRWKRIGEQTQKRDCKSVKITQLDYNGNIINHFDSITQAEKTTGINRKSIRWAISGKQKSAGGYIWRTDTDTDENPTFDTRRRSAPTKENYLILQVTIDGEIVAEYTSIAQASEATGISTKAISKVINGSQKTAGGYHWIRKTTITMEGDTVNE